VLAEKYAALQLILSWFSAAAPAVQCYDLQTLKGTGFFLHFLIGMLLSFPDGISTVR